MESNIAAGTFKNENDAREVLAKLEAMGVTSDQISFITTEETRSNFRYLDNDNSDDGADVGANVGGIGGAIVGALAVTGAVLIPGLNVVVAGPLFGALAGLAVGAGAGGMMGALIGAGLSEEDAMVYETEIKKGGIVVAVNTINEEQKKQVVKLLKKSHAQDLAA